jgi:RNA polymerase sigma-70 factor (ECF subfamily)
VASEAVSALEELPSDKRQAARLFYLKGLTISEIAKRTRSPEGTVKRRLFEARRHMRKALGISGPKSKSKKEKIYE